MQLVKRQFFALRNGIVADTMRRSGSPFKIIFGLNLPQIADVAAQTGVDDVLAQRLWENVTTRESMLLAPMIVDRANFDKERALQWISQIPCREVADILCHRLLHHMEYAPELVKEMSENKDDDMLMYTSLRLAFNLVQKYPNLAIDTAAKFKDDSYLKNLAAMLTEEARLFHLK